MGLFPVLSFIIFLTQCLRLFYPIALSLFPCNAILIEIGGISLPVFFDLHALSGSAALLILSKTTRKEHVKFYYRKNIINTTPVFVPPQIQQPSLPESQKKGNVAIEYHESVL